MIGLKGLEPRNANSSMYDLRKVMDFFLGFQQIWEKEKTESKGQYHQKVKLRWIN